MCAAGRPSRRVLWRCSPPSSWRLRSRPRRRPRSASGRTTAPPAASCHDQGTPTDATCADLPHRVPELSRARPAGRATRPGQDTSTLSTPSSACSQECHLWNATQKQYIIPSTHGTNPHLGSTTAVPRLPSDEREHRRSRLEPAPQRAGPRVHRVRRVPLVAAEARRQGRRAPAATRTRTAFHLYAGQQPRLQEVRLLPLHEARRHEGPDQQVRRPATRAPAAGRRSTPRRSPRSSCAARATPRSCTRAPSARRSRAAARATAASTTPRSARRPSPSARGATRPPLRHANGFQCTLCHRRAVHTTRPSADQLRSALELPAHQTRRHRRGDRPHRPGGVHRRGARRPRLRRASAAPARATSRTWTSTRSRRIAT